LRIYKKNEVLMELRDCPFCGFDEGWVKPIETGYVVKCKVCKSQGPPGGDPDSASAKWNGILKDAGDYMVEESIGFQRNISPKRSLGIGIYAKSNEIFRKTVEKQQAYSFHSYGSENWMDIIKWLLEQGYLPDEVEEVMRSKIMRWCSDFSEKSNRNCTLKDFLKYNSIKGYKDRGGKSPVDSFLDQEIPNPNRWKRIKKSVKESDMGGVSAPMATLNNTPGMGNAQPASMAAMSGAQQYDQSARGSGDLWGSPKKGKKTKKKTKKYKLPSYEEFANQIK